MIAVDTSALIAIVLKEPDYLAHLARLKSADHAVISTVSVVESKMVAYGRVGPSAVELLEELLSIAAFSIVPPGPKDIDVAWMAFLRYGKGSGHPAGLNFGDVFAYALAKTRNVPLLFKGNDFARTDIVSAL
jgi:ribonuclease VapC